MKGPDDSSRTAPRSLAERSGFLLIPWTLLVGLSAGSTVWLEHDSTHLVSTAHVRASINKDISFRKWATSHGGVYVPPTDTTPPNPWLDVPRRDVTTTDGQALTLMNPAYMVRELQQLFPSDPGTHSHLSSLKPLNPDNAPDAWERQALLAFEAGVPEVEAVTEMNGVPTLRLMRPLRADQGCLKCHGKQGYRAGDIRGGVASSLDLRPLLARQAEHLAVTLSLHGLLWGLGALALLFNGRRARRQRDAHLRAREALQRSEQNLLEAQAVAHVGSWHLDIAANALVWSDETYRLFGVPAGTPLTLERFFACIHPDDRERVGAAWTAAIAKAPYDIEHRIVVGPDVRWVRERAQVTFEGATAVRATGTVEDITVRKQLAAEAQEARLAAEAATRAKSQFLANMSHEIRTPLNGVLGMAQLLNDPQLGPAERLEYAQTIYRSGESLLFILNDVLDLAKVEAGKVELARVPFTPAALLAEVRQLYLATAHGQGLSLLAAWHGPSSCTLLGDPARLRQVLANLVSNAVKFTPQGEVRLEGHLLPGDRLVFTVTDTGIGIPPEAQDRLFKPFSQLDDGNAREHGGTGLGLAIARSFAQAMGGDITVESRAGHGTTFTVTLVAPAAAAVVEGPALEPTVLPPRSASARPLRVLVVEDVEVNRRVVGALLTRFGVVFETAADGLEAVEKLSRRHDFDAVLMDCQMPRLDGVEATQRVRAWEATHGAPHTLIIALTAGAFEADRERCLAAGMDEFVAKPLTVASLARVFEVMRQRVAQ